MVLIVVIHALIFYNPDQETENCAEMPPGFVAVGADGNIQIQDDEAYYYIEDGAKRMI